MSFQNYITYTVTAYANVSPEEVPDIRIPRAETLFEINFSPEWIICYINLSGEILDFLTEPVFELETNSTEPHSSKCGFLYLKGQRYKTAAHPFDRMSRCFIIHRFPSRFPWACRSLSPPRSPRRAF